MVHNPEILLMDEPFGSLDDIIYAVGMTMGYWEEEGIDIRVEASAAGSSETKMVAAGRGDSCGASPYVLLPAIESGIPLISYFQVDSINFFCFGFHPDKGFKEMKDLEGKTIALGNIAWKNISDANLIAGGVDPNSVEYVVLGENRAQMTWDKQCDAVLTWEKEYQQWQGRGMNFGIIKGWDYLKGPANSLSTTAANLNNPEFLERAKRAVRGYAKSIYFIRCNPRAATQICLDMFPAITIEFDMALRSVEAATAVTL
jgi:ABC-type nitrate/sulfonate/bicarbonate transport system substrate-binding protein